jgi:uncharacterized protein (DUF1015 family)
MADVQPFRALRYDPARVDPARAIAPPYDVISPELQADLYARSPHNIIRIEYGEQSPGDTAGDSRYTRAASALRDWRQADVLRRENEPALYHYRLGFEWDGERHERDHIFGVVRLEEWEKGVVKAHEHTLSGPKQDRLYLLRATRTQVSPVYCLYQPRSRATLPKVTGDRLYDFEANGQRHTLSTITSGKDVARIQEMLGASDFYIADGHHRYETALAYRDECRAAAATWTGGEPENFVLMAVTDAADPGLLVLPTHRLVHRPMCAEWRERIEAVFDMEEIGGPGDDVIRHLDRVVAEDTAFVAIGLELNRAHLLTLRDRTAAEALMPVHESAPWKRLDVNVLQFAILQAVFGIDEAALKAGGAVSYIQSPAEAAAAVIANTATAAFLLNATPVEQITAVSDVNGRMPQKSTYFYPKLPTGLVLNALD